VKWSVVVPTNRPDKYAEFIDAWAPLFKQHKVLLHVIQDLPHSDPGIIRASAGRGFPVDLHDWSTIRLQSVPKRTDMVRSWGVYQAWKEHRDFTLTLDDDVVPEGDIFDAYQRVFEAGAVVSEYLDVGALTSYNGQLRGFPFRDRTRQTVAVQVGGWHGVLDYDAPTQLGGVKPEEFFRRVVLPVPRGAAVTCCIMNCAWRTEYAPLMWQLPLFEGRFNRFGDIWAGLFAKKTLDASGLAFVVNGVASVRHERASDPLANLHRESPGIPVNEGLWDALEPGDYRQVTDSAHRYFKTRDHEYAQHFLRARNEWLALFR
jgi:hypothetical protein